MLIGLVISVDVQITRRGKTRKDKEVRFRIQQMGLCGPFYPIEAADSSCGTDPYAAIGALLDITNIVVNKAVCDHVLRPCFAVKGENPGCPGADPQHSVLSDSRCLNASASHEIRVGDTNSFETGKVE